VFSILKWTLVSFAPALEMNDEGFLLAAWNGTERLLIFLPQRFTTNPEWKVRGSAVIASVPGTGPFPGSDWEFSSCSHRYLPSHYKLSRWKMNIFPPTILFPPATLSLPIWQHTKKAFTSNSTKCFVLVSFLCFVRLGRNPSTWSYFQMPQNVTGTIE